MMINSVITMPSQPHGVLRRSTGLRRPWDWVRRHASPSLVGPLLILHMVAGRRSPVAAHRPSSLLLVLPRPPRRDSPQLSTFMRVDGAVIPIRSLSSTPPKHENARVARARRNRHRRRDQGRHDARPIPPVESMLRLSREAGK